MSVLFEPYAIGRLTLKNRFIKSSTAESMAGADGEVTPAMLDFYEATARGGAACIFLGHGFVHPLGKAYSKMTGLHDDCLIPGLRSLAEVIHRHDCHVFAQLNHGGSRVQKECAEPVGPSPVVNPSTGLLARELGSSEIWEIIRCLWPGCCPCPGGWIGRSSDPRRPWISDKRLSFSSHQQEER